MTTALLCTSHSSSSLGLAKDLLSLGITLSETVTGCDKLVHSVVLHAPNVVICDVTQVNHAWFEALQTLAKVRPTPTILFTQSTDDAQIAAAVEVDVDVYVMQGYGANRLRSLILLAQARHTKNQRQRREMSNIATRYEERKAVDRAKGILMRTKSLSDDDAFRVLRTAAMNSNQRMGQLSQNVIRSAQLADAVNRSGQLRMLSQRILSLHLLCSLGVQEVKHAALLDESIDRVDENVTLLRKSLSQPTYGDLLDGIAKSWESIKTSLANKSTEALEQQAESLLREAERLTTNLERSGAAGPLHVLNLAGRQRMLSQRFVKYALLSVVGEGATVDLAQASIRATKREFEEALTYLNGIPLSTPDIHSTLAAAGVTWLRMVNAAQENLRQTGKRRVDCLIDLAAQSETLLTLSEQLSTHYEMSMQMLFKHDHFEG